MAFSGDPVAFQMQLRFGVNCFFNVDTKRLVLPPVQMSSARRLGNRDLLHRLSVR